MTLTIRPVRADDEAALLALARDFVTSFTIEPDTFAHTLRDLLTSPDAYLAVADTGEAIVGYVLASDHATFFANGRVTWVEEITVRQDLRRAGIGKALMAGAEDWARARGCRLITLATRRASDFYLALGYEESATYFRKRL